MSTVSCCQAAGSESGRVLLAVLDLFILVVAVSLILMRHFNARDARLRVAWQGFVDARAAFMDAAERYQRGPVADLRVTIAEMLQLGIVSMQAFNRVRGAFPEAVPDADWTNTLLWAQSKASLFGIQ